MGFGVGAAPRQQRARNRLPTPFIRPLTRRPTCSKVLDHPCLRKACVTALIARDLVAVDANTPPVNLDHDRLKPGRDRRPSGPPNQLLPPPRIGAIALVGTEDNHVLAHDPPSALPGWEFLLERDDIRDQIL